MVLEELLLTDFTEEQLLKAVPILQELKEFKNGKVLKHTILAIKNAPLDLEIRLALVFHDIGKPKVYTRVKGEDKYPMHQVVSERIAREFLSNYLFKNKIELEIVYTLIREHMNKRAKTNTDKAITRLYNRTKDAFPKLLEMFKADVLGYKNPNLLLFEKVQENIDKWKAKDRTVFKASEYYAINGYDLLELGYKGKELGQVLTYLQFLVDKDISLNTKEILLDKLKEWENGV